MKNLIGTELVLISITDKIQNKKLSAMDERDILFPADKDKSNPYLLYLQACIYAFGTNTINPDPDKVMKLINLIVNNNIDASAGWAMNL